MIIHSLETIEEHILFDQIKNKNEANHVPNFVENLPFELTSKNIE